MTVDTKRPSLLRRLFRWDDVERERAAWYEENLGWQHNDILEGYDLNALQRRQNRTNADMVATFGAVFAAVKVRMRMIVKPKIVLLRWRGDDAEEIPDHPAITALRRVNESLTFRQGLGLIEQHKCTAGEAYWVKRRDGLGTPVEFEIWDPRLVTVVPRKDKPWAPAEFRRQKDIGTVEAVQPKDVVWFRHVIDPRNYLSGLSPISAVRIQADTGMEAQRYNQRFFDNSAHLGQLFTVEEAGAGEVQRIEKELERKFKGTDKAFRAMVTSGKMEVVEPTISHRDMQFLEQQQYTVEDVARVFELTPLSLGDLRHGTYENMEQIDARDWSMIADQLANTLEELNEFLIRPDFGEEFELAARYDDIPALQADRKLQAEVDEIYLRNGKIVVNELRERDGQEAVEWGDTPLMPTTIAPLGSAPPGAPQPPRTRSIEDVQNEGEDRMALGWSRRLKQELQAIIAHLDAADKRDITPGDVDAYDWDWERRYGRRVRAELAFVYGEALAEAGFVETPLMSAASLSVDYGRRRGAEMLGASGRQSVTATTRRRVRQMVVETLESGESLGKLKNRLREDFMFSSGRAETIARTETAFAIGDGTHKSYESQGHEGKEWLTAGDANVCPICAGNEAEGAIRLGHSFNSGHDTVPGHPRCRCTLLPVKEMEA